MTSAARERESLFRGLRGFYLLGGDTRVSGIASDNETVVVGFRVLAPPPHMAQWNLTSLPGTEPRFTYLCYPRSYVFSGHS